MTKEGLYNYIGFLIREARDLIAQRNYQEAVWRCLIESQDGWSGWIKEVNALFNKPQTSEDAKLRTQLRDVNLRAAQGLLSGVSSVDHYLTAADVLAAQVCLNRVDPKNISPELLKKLFTFILQCEKY